MAVSVTLQLCNKLMDHEDILADALKDQWSYFHQLCRSDISEEQRVALTEQYVLLQESIYSAKAEIHKISKMLES